jgi:drug/metabolite transporter (DMT)-like permease
MIKMDPSVMIWFRTGITGIFLWIWFTWFSSEKVQKLYSFSQLWKVGWIGWIIALHWILFYKALQVSNISVTMMGFSSGTLFSSVLEPWMYRRKFRVYEAVLGLGIVAGIGLIYHTAEVYRWGLMLGIGAALTSSWFSIKNGLLMQQFSASVISRWQMLFAFTGISVWLFFNNQFSDKMLDIDRTSLIAMTLLIFVCTLYPYIASLNLLKHLSPYTITLTVNLETLYGIGWGILILSEHKELDGYFYAGMIIILTCVFLNPWLKKKYVKE